MDPMAGTWAFLACFGGVTAILLLAFLILVIIAWILAKKLDDEAGGKR